MTPTIKGEMRDQEILQKAIDKAVKNGWELPWGDVKWSTRAIFNRTFFDIERPMGKSAIQMERWVVEEIIFSHDFAKAFWPGNGYCSSCEILVKDENENHYCGDCSFASKLEPTFLYHLREMVISENPIKYLAQFLEAKE